MKHTRQLYRLQDQELLKREIYLILFPLNIWEQIDGILQYLSQSVFKKSERDIVIASDHLSVMLSPPSLVWRNLVCELLTWMGRATAKPFLAPPPGALGRGQTVKYHLIPITKSISKILYQTLCLF